MKKLVMTVAVLACAASVVTAQTVTSANMVGYAKVEAVGGQLTLAALNFEPSTNLVSAIIGDQLPATSVLHIWDKASGSYNSVSKAARGGWPAGATIDLGQAFWIQAPAGSGTNEIILSGEVLLDATNSTSIASGIDATGYYYPVDTLWVDTDLANALPATSVLHIWDEATQGYESHSKAARGGWTDAGSVMIGPTTGFWVQTASGLSWDEERPFTP